MKKIDDLTMDEFRTMFSPFVIRWCLFFRQGDMCFT